MPCATVRSGSLSALLVVVIVAVAAWLMLAGKHSAAEALRLAAFNVVSVVTTTGYATADYTLWGNLHGRACSSVSCSWEGALGPPRAG